MASRPYFQSLIWLVCSGGVGYGLLRLTEPSKEKLERIKATGGSLHLTEEERKKVLFMRRLREAAGQQSPSQNTQSREI